MAICTLKRNFSGRPSSRTQLLLSQSQRRFSSAAQSWSPATVSLSCLAHSPIKSLIKFQTRCRSGTWRIIRCEGVSVCLRPGRVSPAITMTGSSMSLVAIWRIASQQIKFASSTFISADGPKCLQCVNTGLTQAQWSSVTTFTLLVASRHKPKAKSAWTPSREFISPNLVLCGR